MRLSPRTTTLIRASLLASLSVACIEAADVSQDPTIPVEHHEFPLPPDYGDQPVHIGSGYVTGKAPTQPIAFPHYTHAQVLGMECQYCHSEARKSKHSGIPPVSSCMGCHQWVRTDRPEIKKLAAYWNNGQGDAVPWKKVHDAPDFVHFAHKPHIRGGLDCTECHGQMQLQGMPERVQVGVDHATGEAVWEEHVVNPVIRETTMQMGWCIDCHANHPSIDKNYGEQADLRRAELKDCWTCHK